MRFLLVTPYFTPQTGGVVTYLEGLRDYLRDGRHEVFVLRDSDCHEIRQCRHGQDDVFELRMRPLWCDESPIKAMLAFVFWFLPTAIALAQFIRDRHIDLVALEAPTSYMVYFHCVKAFTGIRVLADIHGTDIHSLRNLPAHERWLVGEVIRRSERIVVHSRSMLADVAHAIGAAGSDCTMLPCWVDCAKLRSQAAETSKEISQPYVLTVAKLYPRKGVDTLLDAIARLGVHGRKYKFVIAGDGPDREMLETRTVELGIEDAVVFLGDVEPSRVSKLMKNALLFVLPSRVEPFGIVFLEAMAFGKAVVGTRVGGIPEFVVDGVNGILIPSEDSVALADRLELLLQDAVLRDRLGREGQRTVETRYDTSIVGPTYERLFASLV